MPARTWALVALALATVGIAFFYHGFVGDIFCLAQLLLWGFVVLLLWPRAAQMPVFFLPPKTAVVVTLMAWWAWLAASFLWATVFSYQFVVFWTLSALVLAFWSLRLVPQHELLWPRLAAGALGMGLVLAGHAAYQFFVHGWEPKSVFLDINSYAAFLMLLLMPASGRWLAMGHESAAAASGRLSARRVLLAAAIAALAFSIALTASRGVLLAVLGAAALLLFFARHHSPQPERLKLLLLLVLPLAAGHFASQGKTGMRLLSLLDPQSAGLGRLLIWQRTWELISASPWLGHGLGSFSLLFPARQHPLDGSAGFMAHNDYLQLWAEGGLPALVLFLGLLASVAGRFMRSAVGAKPFPAAWLELCGITAGLAALAAHSLLNFNLYVLPSLLVAGGLLARFHLLSEKLCGEAPVRLDVSAFLRPGVYRLVLVLLGLVAAFYWSSALAGNYLVQRAAARVEAGDYDAADRDLARAAQWQRGFEGPWVARAELYRQVLEHSPQASEVERLALARAALEWLEEAERLNPYRHDVPYIRALLGWRLREAVDPHWRSSVRAYFEQSLTRQPRFYTARADYARFLLAQGTPAEAYAVLEKGMIYNYIEQPRLIPYLELAAGVRRRFGDEAGALALESRIAAIRANLVAWQTIGLDQWRPFSLYRLFGGT